MLNKIVSDLNKEIETVKRIISDEFQEKTLEILPIFGKGSVNRVLRAETETAQYIVRLNSINSLDEYKKEVWATDQAIEKEIPTPRILRIGICNNQAYSIQEFVKGIEGRDLSADKKFIWKKLGEYARQIQCVKVSGFGLDFADMTEGDSQKMWLRYLNYNINSLDENDELLRLKVVSVTQLKVIRDLFENLKSREFNFGLNHGDLSLKNTIIDDSGTVHLIDWGSAEASIVPHHDLIELLKMSMQENSPDNSEIELFLKGYGVSEDEYKEMLPDLESILLLRAFDKLRWAIDWKIADLDDYIFHAKEAVIRVLVK